MTSEPPVSPSLNPSGRLSTLLAALLGLYVLQPFLGGAGPARMLLPLLLSAVLLAGLYALSEQRRMFLLGTILIVPALVASWSALLVRSVPLLVGSRVMMALFFVITMSAILVHVLRQRRVTGDTLAGSACVYLLIGLVFAFVFWSFHHANPESFRALSQDEVTNIGAADPRVFSGLVYFSLVTLTTLGYGDITPVSEPARAFAALEAMAGQFFLAILVARLVGLLIADAGGSRS